MPNIPIEGALSALAIFTVLVALVWKVIGHFLDQAKAREAERVRRDNERAAQRIKEAEAKEVRIKEKDAFISQMVRDVTANTAASTSAINELAKAWGNDEVEKKRARSATATFQKMVHKEHGLQTQALELLLDHLAPRVVPGDR